MLCSCSNCSRPEKPHLWFLLLTNLSFRMQSKEMRCQSWSFQICNCNNCSATTTLSSLAVLLPWGAMVSATWETPWWIPTQWTWTWAVVSILEFKTSFMATRLSPMMWTAFTKAPSWELMAASRPFLPFRVALVCPPPRLCSPVLPWLLLPTFIDQMDHRYNFTSNYQIIICFFIWKIIGFMFHL